MSFQFARNNLNEFDIIEISLPRIKFKVCFCCFVKIPVRGYYYCFFCHFDSAENCFLWPQNFEFICCEDIVFYFYLFNGHHFLLHVYWCCYPVRWMMKCLSPCSACSCSSFWSSCWIIVSVLRKLASEWRSCCCCWIFHGNESVKWQWRGWGFCKGVRDLKFWIGVLGSLEKNKMEERKKNSFFILIYLLKFELTCHVKHF